VKKDRRIDDAKVHLDVYGQTRVVDTKVRVGKDARLLDLWSTARDISEELTRASLEQAAAKGKTISCKAGCGACCRQLVPISGLEATALLDVVAKMPKDRQTRVRTRFAAAVQAMEDAGLLDRDTPKGRGELRSHETEPKAQWDDISRRYWSLRIACPFLEDESCSIYADRPMICREYHVTTPVAYCETLDGRTRAIDWPVRMSEVLATTAGRVAGLPQHGIPFTLALEWAEEHGKTMRAPHDGERSFRVMMDVVQEKVEG
jgi:Fe-S-cluster containining protein